jgi:23S rRNA (uracil1939-C5)-methyltransferase
VFVKEGVAGLEGALKALLAGVPGALGLGATGRSGYRLVAGEASLVQTLGSTRWLIPHNGFFQTNEPQAGVLLDLVRREARATKADRVLDLYCGAGFFGLALAPLVKEVVGIEENPQSVAAAEASARASGRTNTSFLAGDLGAVLDRVERAPSEIAVVDPPREGLLPRARDLLIARAPKRIVYISCYPQSLARDLKALFAAGWKGVSATPVDMFPHTSHLETVVTLERVSP